MAAHLPPEQSQRRPSPVSASVWLPILKGKLRGKKWLLGSGGKLLRVLLHSYEPEQTAQFERLISRGDVVFDLGAHVGYYTILASVLVGAEGQVFAFEPHPQNTFYLQRHAQLNRCDNVTVVQAAVGDRSATVCFKPAGSGTGHLSAKGKLRVEMVSLDEFVAERQVTPGYLKIDTEGAEVQVLQGAGRVLRQARPVIFLSTHGRELHEECCRLLAAYDYRTELMVGNDVETGAELLCYPI